MSNYKALNKKQLAAHPDLQVSVRTLNKWLEPHADKIGEVRGGIYTPKQVKIILDLLT